MEMEIQEETLTDIAAQDELAFEIISEDTLTRKIEERRHELARNSKQDPKLKENTNETKEKAKGVQTYAASKTQVIYNDEPTNEEDLKGEGISSHKKWRNMLLT
jgi:hypothetical protein